MADGFGAFSTGSFESIDEGCDRRVARPPLLERSLHGLLSTHVMSNFQQPGIDPDGGVGPDDVADVLGEVQQAR